MDDTAGLTPKIKNNKIFFGWWTVLGTGIICGLVQGFYVYGISVIFKPLSAELGFNRAVTSVGAGIGKLEGGITGPLTGWLVDKFGPKWVIFYSVLFIGVGLVLVNYIQSLWAYYVVWGVIISSGVNMGLTLPVDKTLTDWFVRKRGLAVGIKFAFISIGGVVVVPIITWLTRDYGWRLACVIWGLVTFATLLLVIFFVRQKRPEYYGLLPDGARAEADIAGADLVTRGIQYASEVQETEFTLRQALKTPTYWILMVAGIGYLATHNAIVVHAIPFLTDMGIDPTLAGFMMSLMIFFTIPSRFFSGVIIDWVKKGHLKFVLAASFLLEAAGIAAFLLKPGVPSVYIFFILFGFGAGAPTTLVVLMRGRYFGRKAYGSIAGFSSMVSSPAALVAPVFAGWVYDTTGNYTSAFILLGALAAFCAVLMMFIKAPAAPSQVTSTSKFM
ncbi:MAG TPA: MFS transporter [Dehalococcoidales bacterium]|nr:MFS transporter [Dehalococcoidales bacterium]